MHPKQIAPAHSQKQEIARNLANGCSCQGLDPQYAACVIQVPKLCGLVKRGIGLNTRTGCARFITALTTRQGADIKPHTAALIKVSSWSEACKRAAQALLGA